MAGKPKGKLPAEVKSSQIAAQSSAVEIELAQFETLESHLLPAQQSPSFVNSIWTIHLVLVWASQESTASNGQCPWV